MSVPGKPNKIQDLFGEWIEFDCPTDGTNYQIAVANRVWDTGTMRWVNETQPGGPAGAVTIADGADITLGAISDAAVIGDNPGTISAKLRGIDLTLQKPSGLGLPFYDYIKQVQAALTDTWTFYTGGAGGTLVATIVITYTDASKAVILNVAKT